MPELYNLVETIVTYRMPAVLEIDNRLRVRISFVTQGAFTCTGVRLIHFIQLEIAQNITILFSENVKWYGKAVIFINVEFLEGWCYNECLQGAEVRIFI